MFVFSPLGSYGFIGGRRRHVDIVFSGDELHYNLATDLTNNYGWNGTDPISVHVRIPSGRRAYATSQGTPAFTVSNAFLNSNSTVHVTVEGTIDGVGGLGGGPGQNGQMGGTAIFARSPITVDNKGSIRGGGGGGGGGGFARGGRLTGGGEEETLCTELEFNGGSGAQGQGGQGDTTGNWTAGSSGSNLGCTVTSGNGAPGAVFGGTGNNGGAGSNSGCNCDQAAHSGGTGGPAGRYADGLSFITWTSTGVRLGATAN